MRRIAILLCAAALCFPAAADAGTFRSEGLNYFAARGEQNRVTISYDVVADEYIFRDEGAPSYSSDGNYGFFVNCRIEGQAVICAGDYVRAYGDGWSASLILGDQDDSATLGAGMSTADGGFDGRVSMGGGEGDDRLDAEASTGAQLWGDGSPGVYPSEYPGNDVLIGGRAAT